MNLGRRKPVLVAGSQMHESIYFENWRMRPAKLARYSAVCRDLAELGLTAEERGDVVLSALEAELKRQQQQRGKG